jgi:hypothetical protein
MNYIEPICLTICTVKDKIDKALTERHDMAQVPSIAQNLVKEN